MKNFKSLKVFLLVILGTAILSDCTSRSNPSSPNPVATATSTNIPCVNLTTGATCTFTATFTPTNSPTETASSTPSSTRTATFSPTFTASPTVTNTPTLTPTPTLTNSPTASATLTDTRTPSNTPTESFTAPVTVLSTGTPTATATSTSSSTPVWINLGKADFSPGAVFFCPLYMYSGTPYVAFGDASNVVTNKAMVMDYTGSAWATVGSPDFSAGTAAYMSLALDSSSGTPYVAYYDDTAHGAVVAEYTAGAWATVGTGPFTPRSGAGQYTSLAVANGQPYVAFVDYDYSTLNPSPGYASVETYNGSNWSFVGAEGFSGIDVSYTSLAVYSNNLYVAFQDYNASKATVMECAGCVTTPGSWVTLGSPDFSNDAINLCMFVDSSTGTPYLAYQDISNNYEVAVMKYSASSWSQVGSSELSAISNGSDLSLFVYNNTPYVAYGDGAAGANSGKEVVKECSGCGAGTGSWTNVGNIDFSPGYTAYNSLFIYNGTPYVSFADATNATATVMYLP